MKFITPIYEGTKGNVQVLNKLLESKGLEPLPLDTNLKATAYCGEHQIPTIDLSFIDEVEGLHNVIVVQQDCDEYYYFDWKIFEL